MRQLIASVPRGQGPRALRLAEENAGSNLVSLEGASIDKPRDVVLMHLPNNKIESVLDELQKLEGVEITIIPQGVIPLSPPASAAPDQTTDVTNRSPLEIFMGGLQSIGSWNGFLGYAACASAVAWAGLYTNTSYLLTAAMLIAPFAGPAMTLALGTARGDKVLIRQSLLRYFTSLLLSILIAFGLSFAMGQSVATELMVENSLVSSVALLLPVVAGAAGALNLCQSERNSLVTAAGPGVLIAASLAPPTAMIGMATVLGEWNMVQSGAFVLLLQLVGINLSGAAVFALFGLSPKGVRYERGKRWLRRASWLLTALGLAGLIAWQFSKQPDLQRSSRSRRIAEDVKAVVERSQLANLVEANVRFTRADIEGQHSLLIVAYVQRSKRTTESDETIKRRLTRQIAEKVRAEGYNVTPLISLTVLEGG